MNILIYRYNSICEPDVIAALLELGHEVFCIELEMEKKTPSPEEVISNVRDAFLQDVLMPFLVLIIIRSYPRSVIFLKFDIFASLWIPLL